MSLRTGTGGVAATVAACVLAVLVSSCAKVGSPTGGPPDDVPPYIVSTLPADSAVHVALDSEVTIVFSESMNRQSVEQSLFISPYPDPYPSLSWNRFDSRVHLNFFDRLERLRTYVITVGSDAADARGVRMKDSYSFAFSTGASLDSGVVRGSAWESKNGAFTPATGATVGLWVLDGRSHEPNPAKDYAEYQTQVGDAGGFSFGYLSPGSYRVFVWRDADGNSLLGPDEALGVPSSDAVITADSVRVEISSMLVTPRDAIPPELYVLRATDRHHVELRFSEPVYSDSIQLSTEYDGILQPMVIPALTARDQHIVYTAQQRSDTTYGVTVYVSDMAGNRSVFDSDTTLFDASSAPDVSPPSVADIELPSPLIGDMLEQVRFWFNDVLGAVDTGSLQMLSDDATVAGNWEVQHPNRIVFRPEQPLPSRTVEWYFPLAPVIDAAGNRGRDTVAVHIRHIPVDSLGEVSGRVTGEPAVASDPIYVRALPFDHTWERVEAADPSGAFVFERLPAGKYVFHAWIDEDGSGTWNEGRAAPFQPAERWAVSDTVTVRPRWSTVGVEIEIP